MWIESLHKNKSWELAKQYKRQKIVGCNTGFRRKNEISGIDDIRYMTYLVAKKYKLREGIDF